MARQSHVDLSYQNYWSSHLKHLDVFGNLQLHNSNYSIGDFKTKSHLHTKERDWHQLYKLRNNCVIGSYSPYPSNGC